MGVQIGWNLALARLRAGRPGVVAYVTGRLEPVAQRRMMLVH
jgi:hypothetical protein